MCMEFLAQSLNDELSRVWCKSMLIILNVIKPTKPIPARKGLHAEYRGFWN